ncbi:MAG: hypothetical protein N4A72_12090 [Bacteroidales bacterium]|jgi:uncharacterized membrane protein|nr:hypothetical protein [Bacteroidales bacterium]
MKKIVQLFLILSFIKGALLFLCIKGGDWLFDVNIWLRYLIFYIVLWFVDRAAIKRVAQPFKMSWIKSSIFLFMTYVSLIFITGALFSVYNNVFDIKYQSNIETPVAVIIVFLILGFILSVINSLVKINNLKKNSDK